MASPSTDSGRMLGRYRLLEQIGAGGLGVVFRARDERLARDVAIKIIVPGSALSTTARHRIRNEALALSRLSHPNIETVFEFDSCDDRDFLVVELIPGTCLDDLLSQGPLPQEQAVSLLLQLLRGLSAAHERGVIHRDLKPSNLRLTPDGFLKILDFGLASIKAEDEDKPELTTETQSSVLSGTLPYMSPEQLRGNVPDARSDIYSAGLVLYEMCTGRLPFQESGALLIDAILNRPIPPPRSFNKELAQPVEAVILKALQKDPKLRYQSAREMLSDLEACSRDSDSTQPWADRQQATGSLHGTGSVIRALSRVVPIAAAALLLCVLILSFVLLRNHFVGSLDFRASLPKQKNLVVLPFMAIGSGPEQQLYCDGFTETVTAKLARDPSLQVPSALEIRAKKVTTIDAARTQFGATLVLIASWQRLANAARINLSLVDAKTGKQLRTDTITEKADDLFSLQDHVVSESLRMLQVEPSENAATQIASHGTTVLTAYDFYVQALGYLQRYERIENVDSAIALLQRAISEDNRYAQAQATLAQAYWYKYGATKEPQWANQAKEAVKQAESLNSRLPEVQLAIANLNRRTGAFAAAESDYKRVLEADPNNVEGYLGLANTYNSLGRLPEAEQTLHRAIEVRPGCWSCYNQLGIFLNKHSRYSEAAEAWRRVTELAPDNVWGYMNVGVTYFNTGKFEMAGNYFRRALELSPNDADLYANIGTVNFFLRNFDEDVRFTQKAIAIRPTKYEYWGNLADAYRMVPGKVSETKDAYKKAISLADGQLAVNTSDVDVLSALALFHSRIGDSVTARQYLSRALRSSSPNADVLRIACLVHLEAGEKTDALQWLDRSVRAGYSREQLTANPELVSLQSDPEFKRIVGESVSFK